MIDIWLSFILSCDATLRLATPLIFCALAGLISERAGIIDISLEGKLLGSAFAAAAAASIYQSVWVGLSIGILVSLGFSIVHGFACITHRGNQIVSGLAINIIGVGVTTTIAYSLFNQGGRTPLLKQTERFQPIHFPQSDFLGNFPVIDVIYSELLSGHRLPVYIAILAVPLASFLLYRTRFGLHLRAVGEVPEAVDSAGISVAWMRYRALLVAGVLCGVAGAYLSTAHGAGFVRDMSAGKGYIALAAMIFGRWRPWPVFFSCLMFGFFEAIASRLQGFSFPLIGEPPVEIILTFPYIVTVIVLAVFMRNAVPPLALGQSYAKDG